MVGLFIFRMLLAIACFVILIITADVYGDLYTLNKNIIHEGCLDSINESIFTETLQHIHIGTYII